MKFVVFIVALAMQCVSAMSHNVYGYFDKKFSVLEWITYLKRLSLIVLMLCSVVLYYVPKSRLYARKACCILIDLVANGLKFALTATETKYEKIKIKEQDKNKEPRIEELYRKVYEENTRNYKQKYINKVDIGDNNYKSVSKCKRKKSYIKHSAEKKHKRHLRHNHHHQNATFKDISSESGATSNSSRQMSIIDEKYEKENVITLYDTSPKTKITIRNMSDNRMNNLQLEKIRDYKDYIAENTAKKIESSLSQKKGFDTVPEIINKSDIKYKPICKVSDYRGYYHYNNNLSITKQHNKVANSYQRQSKKNCITKIDGQIVDSHYNIRKDSIKHELCKKSPRKNYRFFHNTNNIIQDCYENSPIITNRVKPILLRIINWFFGGCPEASRRQREQIDEVGKEEIFKSTNTWLL